MEEMGYGDSPVLIYAHSDTANNHVHIITSRVGLDGRKIVHDLEGKRAYKILNELLGKDIKKDFGQHLEDALSYNFSNVAQFQLLMERMGYITREKEGSFRFYRYGTEQGRIAKTGVEQKAIENNRLLKNPEQLRAIIRKYSRQYDTAIQKHVPVRHSTEKPRFESELTDFLKEKFGYEFVFFAGKEKDRPYGYAIIDHRNKAIFKGSDVMNMQVLENLGNSENRIRQQPPWHHEHDRKIEIRQDPQVVETDLEQRKEQYHMLEEAGSVIGKLLDLIGDTTKGTTIQSSAEEMPIKKKKKRRFF